MNEMIKINDNDNVLICMKDTDTHKRGHKYAEIDLSVGDIVIKYGQPIGHAIAPIKKGEHIHTHNIKTNLNDTLEYTYKENNIEETQKTNESSVMVYPRENDQVGIRNELWIVPTVGCVNGISTRVVDIFKKRMKEKGLDLDNLPYFDGIYTYTHTYGCSQMGDDHINTRESLQRIVSHPNAGGVLVLGLGCENNQIAEFKKTFDYDEDRVKFLVTQDVEDEIEASIHELEILFERLSHDKRIEKPLSVLKIGLECGGSDGLSGITANPLVGLLSDYVINRGGTAVLTEVPEMFGAETLLMNRCTNKEVFDKTVSMVNGFKDYYKAHNQVIYENPSPGNKDGGISTLEDKSLGCVTKAGSSPVVDVLKSTDVLKKQGLNLISGPGNDAIATTILGMCGCHMVLFTTGRGTPFGGFIPTLKLSTNTPLANRKKNWIDFDAGRLTDGKSFEELRDELVGLVVETANGKYTKQEENNYREIAIFKSGVTL